MQVLDNGMKAFETAVKSDQTLKLYNYSLQSFLQLSELESPEKLLCLGKKNPKKLSDRILTIIVDIKKEAKLSASLIQSIYKATKLFVP